MVSASYTPQGKLSGHRDWISALACPKFNETSLKVISASRDKTLVVWKETQRENVDEPSSIPIRRLEGHSDFVSDLAISNNAEYAVSSSWDHTLRLWNLKTGEVIGKFTGHTADVVSVEFSPDNRQIVSSSRDGKIKLWTVKGDCIFTFEKDSHEGWINCVQFSPNTSKPSIISGGADGLVKVWSLTEFKCTHTFNRQQGPISSITISPDGSFCAAAGKNGSIVIWDIDKLEYLYEKTLTCKIHSIMFSPTQYYLCISTDVGLKAWNIELNKLDENFTVETKWKKQPECISATWSIDGNYLYAGYTDNIIREWSVSFNESS